eukprot:CAMPEP_0181220384 /NCGR_PEP_ID=MMETSP1096-20121128/28809_1 /TAXON_ID=156174 ORGANISM="Chrysochromulina ericina, Strain CCMP281" /NCGR_SAMPLE_ID=MMETSP1096 /ASSEMBLY_ACC=CAM_ASM_000453 /LENGTH=124 /DNA_ID=CAMNT_0023312885 /DNA_START=224 /DNA_END=598 /DNA_ORIENTATION=+
MTPTGPSIIHSREIRGRKSTTLLQAQDLLARFECLFECETPPPRHDGDTPYTPRLQAASSRLFGPHLEVGHLATEIVSPGKIVPAGGAAVAASPAGIIVTEIGVRVGSHGSARIPKGQVVPTSP